jgi:protein-tyrosine-phosphatase
VAATRIVTLCTGNAARSVMLGYMLNTLAHANAADWEVRTAGTHAVEGQAMSPRTLEALEKLEELGEHHFRSHRSHQLTSEDAEWADVIIAVESDHVNYVRTHHPNAASRTVQLRSFCLLAPLDADVASQVADVASSEPEPGLDIADPAGGDQSTYDLCAVELWDLAQVFAALTLSDVEL